MICELCVPSCFQITLGQSIVEFGGHVVSWYRCLICYDLCPTDIMERAFITFVIITCFTSVIHFSITIESHWIVATDKRCHIVHAAIEQFTVFRLSSLLIEWPLDNCLSVICTKFVATFVVTFLSNGELNHMMFFLICPHLFFLVAGSMKDILPTILLFVKSIKYLWDVGKSTANDLCFIELEMLPLPAVVKQCQINFLLKATDRGHLELEDTLMFVVSLTRLYYPKLTWRWTH